MWILSDNEKSPGVDGRENELLVRNKWRISIVSDVSKGEHSFDSTHINGKNSFAVLWYIIRWASLNNERRELQRLVVTPLPPLSVEKWSYPQEGRVSIIREQSSRTWVGLTQWSQIIRRGRAFSMKSGRSYASSIMRRNLNERSISNVLDPVVTCSTFSIFEESFYQFATVSRISTGYLGNVPPIFFQHLFINNAKHGYEASRTRLTLFPFNGSANLFFWRIISSLEVKYRCFPLRDMKLFT